MMTRSKTPGAVEAPLFDQYSVKIEGPHWQLPAEPLFAYYSRSARREIAAIRQLFERWLANWPPADRSRMAGRLRSFDDYEHQSAFFELYVHELLRGAGFDVEPHIPAGSAPATHPDFVVRANARFAFFAEATCVTPAREERSREKLEGNIWRVLQTIDSPRYWLAAEVVAAPDRTPPLRAMKKRVQAWVDRLPAAPPEFLEVLGAALEAGDLREEAAPSPWVHWERFVGGEILFSALPKSPEACGRPGLRPVASIGGPVEIVDNIRPLEKTIREKAGHYKIDQPLLVFVDHIGRHPIEDDEIDDALFGQSIGRERRPLDEVTVGLHLGRRTRGAFVANGKGQSRRASGAVVFDRLAPEFIASREPLLFHNPWARHPLAPELWPFAQVRAEGMGPPPEWRWDPARALGLTSDWLARARDD